MERALEAVLHQNGFHAVDILPSAQYIDIRDATRVDIAVESLRRQRTLEEQHVDARALEYVAQLSQLQRELLVHRALSQRARLRRRDDRRGKHGRQTQSSQRPVRERPQLVSMGEAEESGGVARRIGQRSLQRTCFFRHQPPQQRDFTRQLACVRRAVRSACNHAYGLGRPPAPRLTRRCACSSGRTGSSPRSAASRCFPRASCRHSRHEATTSPSSRAITPRACRPSPTSPASPCAASRSTGRSPRTTSSGRPPSSGKSPGSSGSWHPISCTSTRSDPAFCSTSAPGHPTHPSCSPCTARSCPMQRGPTRCMHRGCNPQPGSTATRTRCAPTCADSRRRCARARPLRTTAWNRLRCRRRRVRGKAQLCWPTVDWSTTRVSISRCARSRWSQTGGPGRVW